MRSKPERILVLYEHGRAGAAAIDLARHLAEFDRVTLTVVGIAPHAPSGGRARCAHSPVEYNEAVADSVAHDLDDARERLGAAAERAAFVLLVDGADQTLEQLARSGGFDLVLLPAHRRPFRKPGHPAASELSGVPGVEIRIVEPVSQPQPPRPRRPADAAG
ncbi:MAG TPA: universal stress protein [Solirubrobacteraceae bacterium]|nr:universal stress protein [Solirubrobacteraceae bacterium]